MGEGREHGIFLGPVATDIRKTFQCIDNIPFSAGILIVDRKAHSASSIDYSRLLPDKLKQEI